MKNNKWIILSISLAIFITVSCKKEDSSNGTKAVFSYIADGYKVNFTNFSTNATEYSWDFGDQTDGSTLSNPVHVFTQKGQYLVTLEAKSLSETNTFIDTVLILGPNIKIDGDFTDWTYVEYSQVNEVGSGGTISAVKTFASAGYLNFYVEGNSDFALSVVDIYLDSDNNPETGLKSWMYPVSSGADFLFEGSVPGAWGDVYQHVGPGNDWNWNGILSFGDAIQFSQFKTVDGKNRVEFAIKKSVLGTLHGFVNFAIVESNDGWTEIGSIPADQSPDSAFGKIPL